MRTHKMNKFDQLVQDLLENKLTLNHIQIAIRTYIRQRDSIPDPIKNLLCGYEGESGLIGQHFSLIQELIGSMELAYRRGVQVGEEESCAEAMKHVLGQIIGSLPSNRDWLDPDLEKIAKELSK